MSGSNLSNDSNAAAAKAPAEHPLGLTVYELPEPAQAAVEDGRRTRRGRLQMLALVLISAMPVIASYFTYYVIRPEGRRVFGELIEPLRPMPDILTQGPDGKVSNLQTLKGQWLLLSVGSGNCQEACVQRLYLQRQMRESLGKNKDRLDRVWLIGDTEPIPPSLEPGLHEAIVLRVPRNELTRWLAPEGGHALDEHLYVIDPNGNWMMRFPAQMDIEAAGKAKRDLERLLRASSSWDQAGR